jgi:hypothetical protein
MGKMPSTFVLEDIPILSVIPLRTGVGMFEA